MNVVAMRTGKCPVDLEPVEMSECLLYLWQWFQEIADGRGYAGMGSPLPISYTEIKAWSELTRTEPTAWEISALKAIDRIYLMETSKK